MAFGDQHYRHSMRNVINSIALAIQVCDRCEASEWPHWMQMIEEAADQAIALIDENPIEGAGEA